ncbi:MAG: 2-amino-4-hydroxy-6-hydroxymethyldihydropteridine diphosphokinase [Bacteroidales bacterium]|nr:2-amino-4-hydroxy-6-hydroxymethyldihydropteridine diphosphokinase [Bacteroidales bacterium]
MLYGISLGSNIGNRISNINQAIEAIKDLGGKVLKQSSIYESEPWGYKSENWFYNAVILYESYFEAEQLLAFLLDIEKKMGRRRSNVNETFYVDRIIDLDILFCDKCLLTSSILTLPHPHLHERLFVLLPLQEISPEWEHPLLQSSISILIKQCSDKGRIRKI